MAILMAVTQAAPAADIGLTVGGITSDRLSGIGGAKASSEVYVANCWRFACGKAAAWRVTEGMDDDKGLMPEHGYTLELTTPGRFMLGVRRDADGFTYDSVVVGFRVNGTIQAGLLLPFASSIGKPRHGVTAALSAPVRGRLSAVLAVDYLGIQDPDRKQSRVGVGLRYSF